MQSHACQLQIGFHVTITQDALDLTVPLYRVPALVILYMIPLLVTSGDQDLRPVQTFIFTPVF